MRKVLHIVLFFAATTLCAQQIDTLIVDEISKINNNILLQQEHINLLTKKLNTQQYIANKHKKTIDTLSASLQSQHSTIDSLIGYITANRQSIANSSSELSTKIKETRETANSKIFNLDNSVNKNRLYWIIATLATLLLGGLTYWLLGKRIKSNRTDVETKIKNTKKSLEEESVKLDNKLMEILTAQLKLKQIENKSQTITSNEKPDHSLALKVADEIIRIQKNLSRMDKNTKGLKQLNSSVNRIQDNFASNGYELVHMLGKEYNEGMKVTANFTPSEDIETGKQIITRIIKPQVNFHDEMIQAAQIEVSIGN